MSDELSWKPPPRQPEAIRWRRIIGMIAFTLLVFAVGVFATWRVYRARAGALNPAGASVPAPLGRETIDELEQAPFPLERRAARERAQALERLRTYGWVDRSRGLAHEPVEVAIEALVASGGGPREERR